MVLLARRRVLAAKIEATPGTAETLSASDAVFNPYNIVTQNETELEARVASAGFANRASVTGAYRGSIAFRHDVQWDGTATETAWADTFLPACGWVKSGQVFTPRTEVPGANVKTITIATYVDGVRKLLRGAVGNFSLVCPVGRNAYFDFTFQGVWDNPTDTGLLTPTYPNDPSLRYAASTTTWDGAAICNETITLASNNEIVPLECEANVAGIGYMLITGRRVTVTGNPFARLVASDPRHADYLNMTEGILTFGIDGPTTSVLTFSAPRAQIVSISEGERNGFIVDEIEWQCNRNGSSLDQEASLTFTAAT
jgi:hypothetical protein